MATEFCSSCWVMLRIVPRNAVRANSASWTIGEEDDPAHRREDQACAIGRQRERLAVGEVEVWIWMPCTTALMSSFDVYAAAAGMTPAIAVVTNRPRVVAGLASQTRRRTRGSAAVVPVTDCLRLFQRPRRSFGPSGRRRRLDRRVAGKAAVRLPRLGLAAAAAPPVDHRRAGARRHHPHFFGSLREST